MSHLNKLLLELFCAHGVKAALEGAWITFPGSKLKACAVVVREMSYPSGRSAQLDVRLQLAPGRELIESFAGLGESKETAVADAFQNFAANSLHPILAAFFLPRSPDVSREEWFIGGRRGHVTRGRIGVRGTLPDKESAIPPWLARFGESVRQKSVRPGTHWVRLCYSQTDRKAITLEVLLDNEVWEDLQADMGAVDWPAAEAFYSVRIFLVLEIERGESPTAETAVGWLAEFAAPRQAFTEAEAYAALADAGVDGSEAARVYGFTQVAWARITLERTGVQFSPEFSCLSAAGEVVDAGLLVDEPHFAAASAIAPKYAGTPGYQVLVRQSADYRTAKNALKRGAKPQDLVFAPVALFLEPATSAGIDRAREAIAERPGPNAKGSLFKPDGAVRTWWRFWG